MGKGSTPESVEHLTQALRDLPIRLERAILFGSRARSDSWEHSDWDVVLVSREFEGVPFPERGSRVLLALSVSDVEPLCYTPDEFDQGREGLGAIGVAVKEGIELIPGRRNAA